jgi:hypothetical protein
MLADYILAGQPHTYATAESQALNFSRFYLPHIYPGLGKVIYLDADLIVRGDIAELHSLGGLETHVIAAVPDGTFETWEEYLCPASAPLAHIESHHPTFNAGVYVTDLGLWRTEGVLERLEGWIRTHRLALEAFYFGTQSIMNLAFYRDFQPLPPSGTSSRWVGTTHSRGEASRRKSTGREAETWLPTAHATKPVRGQPENPMSGFLVTRNPAAERCFIARRGPDLERTLGVEGYRFTHYLVDVAGRRTSQPFVDGNVVCVFDGEIYGTPSAGNDPANLTSLYRRHGDGFARHLDGEFAVALYDFGRRILVLATDPFGTKPLFRRGTEAASYASGLGEAERIPPNTIIVADLDRSHTQVRAGISFDFDHQAKSHYDDWIAAFEGAVRKRAATDCYLPLSAGYDSGGIACALRRLDLPGRTYSVAGEENLSLLAERGRGGDILRMDAAELAAWNAFLRPARGPRTACSQVPYGTTC